MGIDKLNPVQEEALATRFIENRTNLVVSSPTGSGKTLISLLAALEVIKQGKKVLYLCPLRALASEHYDTFKKVPGLRVALSTGDLDSRDHHLQNYDLIITTTEKADSLMRHKSKFVPGVGLLVADEIHLLDTNRGATLETIITRFRQLLPKCQIIALSATVPNAKEIADWLGAELVESDWRPTRLTKGVYYENIIETDAGTIEVSSTAKTPVLQLVEDTVARGGQSLVFVNTRRSAVAEARRIASTLNLNNEDLADKILSALESPTRQCKELADIVRKGAAFHTAALVAEQRKLIESAFREGKIKAIAATPTLCLPPDTRILLSDGSYTPIKKVGVGMSVKSLDPKTLKLVDNKVVSTGKRKTSGLVKLVTRTGKKIELTSNHPILVNEFGELKWIQAGKLTKDMWVATPRLVEKDPVDVFTLDVLPHDKLKVIGSERVFGRVVDSLLPTYKTKKTMYERYGINENSFFNYLRGKTSIPLDLLLGMAEDAGLKQEGVYKGIKRVLYSRSPHLKDALRLPLYINKDLVKFIAYMLADGSVSRKLSWWVGHSYVISFTSSDKAKIKEFQAVVRRVFGLNSKVVESYFDDGVSHVRITSKTLGLLLECFGVTPGRKAHIIRICPFFFSLSNELILEFIFSLIECDGCFRVQDNAIEYYTSSKDFATDLQSLLLSQGVISSIYLKKNDGVREFHNQFIVAKHPHYRLVITGKSAKRLFNRFGIKTNQTKTTYEKDQIPLSMKLLELRKKLGISTYEARQLSGVDFWVAENTHRVLTRKTVKKICSVPALSSPPLDDIKRLAFSDIYWEEIKDITKQKKKTDVFDLSVESTHSFVANNIIVHNSMGVNLPADTVIVRDLSRYTENGLSPISVREYLQMCGRAGRPNYSKDGLSVCVAKDLADKDTFFSDYVMGKPEKVYSQLGFEPVLRTQLLASIAVGFTPTRKKLDEFLLNSFYAFQYGEIDSIRRKADGILRELEDWGFVTTGNHLLPTPLGRRVSELYLDPFSAYTILKALRERSMGELGLLYMLTATDELRPYLRARSGEESTLWANAYSHEKELGIDCVNVGFEDYNFLDKYKTTLLLRDWLEELHEDSLLEKYGVAPGILRAKLSNWNWVSYAAIELAKLEHLPLKELRRVERRIKYGVRGELLPLVELKNIGRVRARKLFSASIKSIPDLEKMPAQDLARVLGPRVAVSVKKQLGEEVSLSTPRSAQSKLE